VILQLITILISRGDVYVLGEAYAFGVVWSFAMKALSVLVLRYKQPGGRGWKVPLNFHIAGTEIPVGLMLITIVLFALALINVVTKEKATISGVSFTIAFFIVFEFSEKYNRRHSAAHSQEMEKFNLNPEEDLTAETAHVRPGSVIVAVRNPNRLEHLQRMLEKTDTRRIDIVVLSVRQVTQAASGEHPLDESQLFSLDETQVFSKVVNLAEKAGKHVELMVVPGSDPYAAIMATAQRLQASRVVMGLSPKMSPAEQGATVGREWENLPEPRPSLSLEIVIPGDEESIFYNLGPHPPRLWPEDIDLLHRLWLELSAQGPGSKLHHRDIVGVALRRMQQALDAGHSDEVVADVMREIANGSGKPPVGERRE
jgi:nucleotide-binding universal stress UspA family protein